MFDPSRTVFGRSLLAFVTSDDVNFIASQQPLELSADDGGAFLGSMQFVFS